MDTNRCNALLKIVQISRSILGIALVLPMLSGLAVAQASASDNTLGPTGPPTINHNDTGLRWDHDVANNNSSSLARLDNVKVSIDLGRVRNIVAGRAFGIHTSVYDNKLIDRDTITLLHAAAIKQAGRFDWGAVSPKNQYPVTKTDFAVAGNSFSVTLPPYTVTDIVFPAAK